ncbi:MAG: hypothetical protein HY509_04030, partial [Acidobacteria bacterium]|nr:hypothetical protein [Acidobacteriota bacterium]
MPDLLQAIPEPDPIPLPGPPGLLRFLLVLTFLLHLLPMNLVLGGSLLGGVTEALGRRGNRPHHRELARWLSRAMPAAIAATITLGVAPLLMLQGLYGRLFFTASILMARPWLAIVPMLILAYYGAYLRALRGDQLGRLGPVAGWGSALLFVGIGFLFSNNMSLMLRPAEFRRMYLEDGRGWHLDAGDPALIPRYLHFLIGSVAVAGMFVVLLGILRRRRQPEFGDWAIRYGSAWFAHPTALNIFVGIVWLVLLPRETMLRFLGGDRLATTVFAAGAALAVVAMILMLQAAKA